MVELMAPAGSYESLQAAIKSGADSVYFGIGQLNMRARSATHFTLKDLYKIADLCKKAGVKSYLTVNTVMYDEDIKVMQEIIRTAKESGISAIIACDIAALEYARTIKMEAHISTQANVSNIEAIKFYSKYAPVVVLARELKLEQIKKICSEIKKQKIKGPNGKLVEIELFIHGALCVAISGKCYMSLAQYNQSANRGLCLQACRRAYRVIDEQTGKELKLENKYVMSPSDLCTIGILDKLIDAGVSVLKIEGRGREPSYVSKVVRIYKEAIFAYEKGSYTPDKVKQWTEELETVFNRGFWQGGYYLGEKTSEWSGIRGSKATKKKIFLGTVRNYFTKAKAAEIQLETGELKDGDEILIIGPTTGVYEAKAKDIRDFYEKPAKKVKKGDIFSISVSERVRKNDKLYQLVKRKI